MIFFKNEMCSVSNESRSYEITLTVLFLMPVLCSCVLGALLGGDLGNSNGACPSPVRKSSHTVTHPAPFCFPCFSCTSLKREMILELTDRATAEYFMCGNRRSRVRDLNTVAHTSRKTPVDWRQLKVTVQAACKQSKDQNGFQVVGEKREERV